MSRRSTTYGRNRRTGEIFLDDEEVEFREKQFRLQPAPRRYRTLLSPVREISEDVEKAPYQDHQ